MNIEAQHVSFVEVPIPVRSLSPIIVQVPQGLSLCST
jgi:hypothetical protein